MTHPSPIINNPFASSLFWPVVARVVILLAVALVAVVAVERKPWHELKQTALFKRVRSWAVIAPVFMIAVFVGGIVGLAIVGYLAAQALGEYGRLVGLRRSYAWLLAGSGVLTLALVGYLSRWFLFAPLAFFVLVTLVPIVTQHVEHAHYQVTSSLFGFIYIPFCLSYLVYIRTVEVPGVQLLLLIGFSVALSDVCAYVVGNIAGGPKLAPVVSPNKTWSGAVGNVAGAYLGLAVMWFALPPRWSVTTVIIVPLVLGIACLFGDLIESFVKRDFGVKDAGDLLPGFGGLLDRIDSLLIAAPFGYYAVILTQNFSVGPGTG